PAAVLVEYEKRLQQPADKPALFLPYLGEFGFQVMYHMRYAYFHASPHKIVCCREEDKVLYPNAAEFFTDWTDPIPDAQRIGTYRGPAVQWPQIIAKYPDAVPLIANLASAQEEEECVLKPGDAIPLHPVKRNLQCDVLLGIRQRPTFPEKNWGHWNEVAAALKAAGITYAVAGASGTTSNVPGQIFNTADHDTDASVEAMQTCKLYVGTDSGASHLASTVGAPMVIFREKASNNRDYTWRMRLIDPHVTMVDDGWTNPAAVIKAITGAIHGNPAKPAAA
ncbi:MAG TPA: glycosyltransferase family 9 protein, partial [Tepidisphaeraceae bacterium]|nr:glycosyltransferase family 9 protein [Tepidisphaeraceae bacterium]